MEQTIKCGKHIKAARLDAFETQKGLAEKIGKGYSTVQKYELDIIAPTIEVLGKIAKALGVTVDFLINGPDSGTTEYYWTASLDEKLKQVGSSLGVFEDDAALWINYPDGTLEVSLEELKELHTSSNEFMRFKLDELKKKHLQDFRPKRSGRNE